MRARLMLVSFALLLGASLAACDEDPSSDAQTCGADADCGAGQRCDLDQRRCVVGEDVMAEADPVDATPSDATHDLAPDARADTEVDAPAALDLSVDHDTAQDLDPWPDTGDGTDPDGALDLVPADLVPADLVPADLNSDAVDAPAPLDVLDATGDVLDPPDALDVLDVPDALGDALDVPDATSEVLDVPDAAGDLSSDGTASDADAALSGDLSELDAAPDCLPGEERPCLSDGDGCPGLQSCALGLWGPCAAPPPSDELCDGVDNDCDGVVDNLSRSCGTDEGLCVAGTETCLEGAWGACVGAVGPFPEVCDGADDDCNTVVDDIAAGTCPTGGPVAVCPPDQVVAPRSLVTLDGSASYDPDGDPLSAAWIVTYAPSGQTSSPTPADTAVAELAVDVAGTLLATLTVSDGVLSDSCTVSITAVPAEDLHVQLVWQEDSGDLDLHLTEADAVPVGAFYDLGSAGAGQDCWFGGFQPATTWGATLDVDDTNGFGPENINIATTPTPGVYTVGVHLWCDEGLDADKLPLPTPGSDGPKNARVRIYCGGALVAEVPPAPDWRTIDRVDDFWLVAQVDWDAAGSCAVTPIDTLEGAVKYTTAAGLASQDSQAFDCHNKIDCAADAECRPWESCLEARGPKWIPCAAASGCTCRVNAPCTDAASCDAERPYCPPRYGVCSRVP